MPQPSVTHSIESLSTTELTRAIHIDFEGHQEQAPVLLGVLIEQRYKSVVLDPTLRSAAAAKGLRLADGGAVLAELLESDVPHGAVPHPMLGLEPFLDQRVRAF